MCCHREVNDATPLVRQHQEHVQDLKPNGRHTEEVYGHEALQMVLQEGSPGLSIWACGPRNVMKMAQSKSGKIAGARSREIDLTMEKSRL
jgi:hypothetical protein